MLMPGFLREVAKLLSKKWCQAVLILFLLIAIGCLWGPASSGEKALLSKTLYEVIISSYICLGVKPH